MPPPDRSELANQYLEQLPYAPYPVQEDALLTWFTADQGVLVCAPTGTGKTLIAQAALFEALKTGTIAYYTTPLIALTEQKFREMQESAVRWGFRADDVGMVTGHRKINPDAKVLVVVAEILLNRLLHQETAEGGEAFDFSNVSAVVMDEFHSFADPERGIVWELSLSLLPAHVRLLLLSATVGNSREFIDWLDRCHNRKIDLVEGNERRVPLTYHWVPDLLLNELVVEMGQGGLARKAPALVFCFNRDECWSVAEQLKGLDLLPGIEKKPLHDAVNDLEWNQGVGPKLKQMLHRGVGVHHAGMLPKYRRVVEDLFQQKLLSVCVCTETLASGINLPARSVVIGKLVKGPFGKEKLLDASSAHQMFGRAGRPQFDTEGHVFAVAPEDDVKILRWKQKYDQIPEDTKDHALMKKKKELKRKKPSRREGVVYWTEGMFDRLKASPPGKLYSKGPLPWRLLAYLLSLSPEVARLRKFLSKRLMDQPRIEAAEKSLVLALHTLHRGGFVTLDPLPVEPTEAEPTPKPLMPTLATPTERLSQMLAFRSIHPLYGAYLVEQLADADPIERLQAFESVLEVPRPLLKYMRVPYPDQLPPGPLEQRIDPILIDKGLIAAPLPPAEDDEEVDDEPQERPIRVAEKLFLLFEATYPDVTDVTVQPVWSAAELLKDYNGNFNLYIKARDLTKQEGIVFRHCLRLVLLLGEFARLTPPRTDPDEWKQELALTAVRLTDSCRQVDPETTEQVMAHVGEGDLV